MRYRANHAHGFFATGLAHAVARCACGRAAPAGDGRGAGGGGAHLGGLFADRLEGGLQRDARQLLGGDVVVVSDNAPPAVFAEQARQRGMRTVQTLSFPTMGRAPDANGGAAKLVALKVVDAGYPLRGSCRPRRGRSSPAG
jgi:predicted lysophospholipase L1 biosynthesis ABC-type transport system permease subunit